MGRVTVQQPQQYDHKVLPLGQAEHVRQRPGKLAQRRILDYNGVGHAFLLLSRFVQPHSRPKNAGRQLYRLVKSAKLLREYQDFRSGRLKGRDMWVAQFGPQVIAQQIGLDLIERLVELLGFDLEGQPGMITAGQMITL
jgi:hypothetical protein